MSLQVPNENDEWTIYGASWCPPCRKVKTYFTDNKIDFVYHSVDDNVTEVIQFLAEHTNEYKSIPMIFNRRKFIGGASDVITLLEDKAIEKSFQSNNFIESDSV